MTRRKPLIIIPVLLVAAFLVWFFGFRGDGLGNTLSASGTIEATEAQLGFQFAGHIDSIYVHEGDEVRAGQVVAVLDRSELLARRDQAKAQVDAAQARLTELESGFRSEEIAQAHAANRAAEEQFNDAERDLNRTKTLLDGGAVSQEILDKAQTHYDVAQSQATQASEQLRLVESGPRGETIAAQRALLEQAEAGLRSAEIALKHGAIRPMFDCVITTRHREPGETIAPGQPVLTIMNRDDRWIRVYIPENRLGAVHLGQNVTITSDTYPDKTYRGDVTYIASEAEFTPKTVQTAEERVKLVYAVKIRVSDDPDYELKPGMPADVRIALGQS